MEQRPIESVGELKVLQRFRELGPAVATISLKGQAAKVGRELQAVHLVAVCEHFQVKRKWEIADFRYTSRTVWQFARRPVQFLKSVPGITVVIVRDVRVLSIPWNTEVLSPAHWLGGLL